MDRQDGRRQEGMSREERRREGWRLERGRRERRQRGRGEETGAKASGVEDNLETGGKGEKVYGREGDDQHGTKWHNCMTRFDRRKRTKETLKGSDRGCYEESEGVCGCTR